MTSDERSRVVAEFELQPGRRDAVRVQGHAELEGLAREELKPVGALVPDECRRRDGRFTGAPFAQPRPALCRVRIVGERTPVAGDGLARRPVEGDLTALEEDRTLAQALDR